MSDNTCCHPHLIHIVNVEMGGVDSKTYPEQYMVMGTRELQTAYVGKQPNCYRVYDKKTERLRAYRNFVRGWHPPEPRFEEWCKRLVGAGGIDPEFEEMCYERGLDPRLELPKLRMTSQELLPLFRCDTCEQLLTVSIEPFEITVRMGTENHGNQG
jgi:hypothetical protein